MPSPVVIAKRIAKMSPHEIRTRAGMALRQRIDVWEARRGKNPLDAGDAGAARGCFFFDEHAAAMLAAEIRLRLPEEVLSVIESARRIASGQFDLLGYRGLSFGSNGAIDWHLDPMNGVRSPYLPWSRVPYLDFQQTGDHKVVWELSRHQHLVLLARAWLYSGDERFLHTLERLWHDWRAKNPYPYGINWTSALEVAFRCLSWIWVDHLTAGATAVSPRFHELLRKGIGESAVYIERYISTYFAPNTHLLGEALALFFVGVLYPGFKRSPIWREYGWNVVVQESERQVRPDGFHFEQSVYYHVYAFEMFLYARILAARNGVAIPPGYDAVLVRMADGLASIGSAGAAPRFGDDDGGRLFDGRRNRPEHLLDPLAAASIVYGRGDWKALSGELREETVWILGAAGLRAFDELSGAPRPMCSRAFPDSGYYVLGSSDAIVIVDAGPHGWGRGGHGHADALSLQWIAGGRVWLTDPGTCVYPNEKPERDRFRGTAAHNTLEVDAVSQAEPIHSFAWKTHPTTIVHRWHEGHHVTVFHGSHDGYRRLDDPVTHARWVIVWADGVWLVRDTAAGAGVHQLAVRWHFAPTCMQTGENVWLARESNEAIAVAIASDGTWSTQAETGEFSPAYGAVIDAPVLRISRHGRLPAECGTLLQLNRQDGSFGHEAADGASVYIHMGSDSSTRAIVFSTPPPGAQTRMWRYEDIESDAEVLGVDMANGLITRLFAAGATTLRIRGSAVRLSDDSADRLQEWVAGPGGTAAPFT